MVDEVVTLLKGVKKYLYGDLSNFDRLCIILRKFQTTR